MKDMDEEQFESVGYYRGSKGIIEGLINDEVDVPIYIAKGKQIGNHRVVRWAFIPIAERRVSNYFDRKEQDFQIHGYAQCKNDNDEKFTPSKDFGDDPMIAVRTYTSAETAVVNCVYYHKYSEHRCNLATDQDLDVGVYAYTDIEATKRSWNTLESGKQYTVFGVLCGY